MTRYPNLLELLEYHPCGKGTVCYHAEIEPELLDAVLHDGEPLMPVEIVRLSRLYRCPVGVLSNPKLIMLDKGRRRHMRMIREVDCIYMQLRAMAGDGNQQAEKYIIGCEGRWQRFMRAAYEGKLSYCHYLGAKEDFLTSVRWSMPEPKRRSLVKTVSG